MTLRRCPSRTWVLVTWTTRTRWPQFLLLRQVTRVASRDEETLWSVATKDSLKKEEEEKKIEKAKKYRHMTGDLD